MSELGLFFQYLKDFRRTMLWALGGSAMVPIVAGLSGLAPPWPQAVTLLTTMYVLLAVILAFNFSSNLSKRSFGYSLLISTTLASIFLIAYLVSLSSNTLLVSNGERIFLGCGWSSDTLALAMTYNIDPLDSCPGDFARILKDANYESIVVWKPSSISKAQWMVVFPWLAFFSTFSYFVGAFLRYSSLNGSPKNSTSTRAKSRR